MTGAHNSILGNYVCCMTRYVPYFFTNLFLLHIIKIEHLDFLPNILKFHELLDIIVRLLYNTIKEQQCSMMRRVTVLTRR